MVSAMSCAWETASLNVTASFGQNMNCWIVTFRPIGFGEQLISDTTSSREEVVSLMSVRLTNKAELLPTTAFCKKILCRARGMGYNRRE